MKGIHIAKYMIIAIVVFLIICIVAAGIFLGVMSVKNSSKYEQINNDFQSVYSDEKYQEPQIVQDVPLVTQKISAGYAIIEMLAKWQGLDNLDEESLYAQNDNKQVTTLGAGLEVELTEQLPDLKITRYKNLTNTEMIDKLYTSLAQGMPVPVELADYDKNSEDKKTALHYILVTAIDVPGDKITALNPFGYEEEYTITRFLELTRYEDYPSMPILYRFGFAVDLINKNSLHMITTQ